MNAKKIIFLSLLVAPQLASAEGNAFFRNDSILSKSLQMQLTEALDRECFQKNKAGATVYYTWMEELTVRTKSEGGISVFESDFNASYDWDGDVPFTYKPRLIFVVDESERLSLRELLSVDCYESDR